MSLSISLLPELDRAFGSRRKCLERLPDDECADQPHAQSMKLGQRANHVAQMPVWGATTIRTTELDVALPFERPKPETTTELLAIFDQTA